MAGVLSTSRITSSCRPTKIRHNVTLTQTLVYAKSVKAVQTRCKSFHFSDPTPAPDYQFIMRSSVPTMHFQKSLPRLPIPDLAKTCEKYLRSQKPLLDSSNFDLTKACVDDFVRGDGIKCQETLILEDKANKGTSYISKPWFDMYLSNRKPLPINFNPFLVFLNNRTPEYNLQLVKATNLVISSLRFYRALKENSLEPEVFHLNPKRSDSTLFRLATGLSPEYFSWYTAYLFKAFPLDMSQFPYLFNTTRVPELGKDKLKHVEGSRHLLVMRKGHFYTFDVLNKDGSIKGPDIIMSSIEEILDSKESVAEHPVGILTTEDRDVWAKARKHLESIGNTEVLELIDTSLFLLVLDDESPGIDPVKVVRLFLHADGVNRWFDKSFSLIVAKDGKAGINFEHSWGDGVAVLRYFNDIHKDSIRKPRAHHDILTKGRSHGVRKLDFRLDDKSKQIITDARTKYGNICKSLEVGLLDYHEFGRNLCKPHNISPDAMMQLSFQIAYDQMTGQQVPTYESCSTAAFKHGRTEAVRPCTIETRKFCKVLRQRILPTRAELQRMIVECSIVHTNLIKEAAMGLGFDRHLFALKLKAELKGLKPTLFDDPAYNAINHNILSTSTLASDCLELGAFGPVVQNGYGIGYSVWNERLGCIVTNYTGHSDGSGFLQSLDKTLNELYLILRP